MQNNDRKHFYVLIHFLKFYLSKNMSVSFKEYESLVIY